MIFDLSKTGKYKAYFPSHLSPGMQTIPWFLQNTYTSIRFQYGIEHRDICFIQDIECLDQHGGGAV